LKEDRRYAFDSDIADVLRIGDAATGTHVMFGLYSKSERRRKPLTLDVSGRCSGFQTTPKLKHSMITRR